MKSSKLDMFGYFAKSSLLFFVVVVAFWYLYAFVSSLLASSFLKPELVGGYVTKEYEEKQIVFSGIFANLGQFIFLFAFLAHFFILKKFSGKYMSGEKISSSTKVLLTIASYCTVIFLIIFFGILFI